MSIRYIFIESDFRLDVAVADADGEVVTDAVVDVEIKDADDELIAGSDITLTHDSGGVYKGWLPKTMSVESGQECYIYITVTADSKQSKFKERLTAYYRGVNADVIMD